MSNRNNPHRGPRAIRLRPRPNANLRPESYYTKKIAAREKAAEGELLAIMKEETYTNRQLDDYEIEDRQQTMRNIMKTRAKDRKKDRRDAQTRLARRKKIHAKTIKNMDRHRKLNSLILIRNIEEVNADFNARIARIEEQRKVALQRVTTQYHEVDYREFERSQLLVADKKTW